MGLQGGARAGGAAAAGATPIARVGLEAMLQARDALHRQMAGLYRRVPAIVRVDATCQRSMTVPSVGALVALTFMSAVDDPGRFRRSRTVDAYFGLMPRKYQSGETEVAGGISRVGDGAVRTALYEAAQVMKRSDEAMTEVATSPIPRLPAPACPPDRPR